MANNNVVAEILRDYMAGGAKKLTLPGLGTFVRRGVGEVIFVDLARRDDGVLRAMVEDTAHLGEVEAMGLVDRFVFELRSAAERTGSAAIEGLGTLTWDGKGPWGFDYSPTAKARAEVGASAQAPTDGMRESLFGGEAATQESLFEGAATAPLLAEPAQAQPAPIRPTTPKPALNAPKPAPHTSRRSDIFIIIAIVVAIAALLAMVFGLSTSGIPFTK